MPHVTPSVHEPRPATRLLFIGGEGRSGSTLLEKALAAHPEVIAVGELKYLWKWGVSGGELCACGCPVNDCDFWSAVGKRLFGPDGFSSAAAQTIRADYEAVSRNRRMLTVYLRPILPRSRQRLDLVRDFLTELYGAIAAESGAAVVVDSSKHPIHLGLLSKTEGLKLTVVQLVRNPCGVTYSWSKAVALPHDPSGQRTMGPHPATAVVARWALMNIAVQFMRYRHRGLLVRYEDFCCQPRQTIDEILELVHLDPRPVPLKSNGAIAVAGGHGIAGNPVRFAEDSVCVVEDQRWRTGLSRFKQVAIKLAILPQAIQYRYVSRRH